MRTPWTSWRRSRSADKPTSVRGRPARARAHWRKNAPPWSWSGSAALPHVHRLPRERHEPGNENGNPPLAGSSSVRPPTASARWTGSSARSMRLFEPGEEALSERRLETPRESCPSEAGARAVSASDPVRPGTSTYSRDSRRAGKRGAAPWSSFSSTKLRTFPCRLAPGRSSNVCMRVRTDREFCSPVSGWAIPCRRCDDSEYRGSGRGAGTIWPACPSRRQGHRSTRRSKHSACVAPRGREHGGSMHWPGPRRAGRSTSGTRPAPPCSSCMPTRWLCRAAPWSVRSPPERMQSGSTTKTDSRASVDGFPRIGESPFNSKTPAGLI